jgi:hypothetical protein
MIADGLGEQVATHLQDLSTWLELNPDATFADYLAERPDAITRTAITSAMMSTIFAGASRAGGALTKDAPEDAAPDAAPDAPQDPAQADTPAPDQTAPDGEQAPQEAAPDAEKLAEVEAVAAAVEQAEAQQASPEDRRAEEFLAEYEALLGPDAIIEEDFKQVVAEQPEPAPEGALGRGLESLVEEQQAANPPVPEAQQDDTPRPQETSFRSYFGRKSFRQQNAIDAPPTTEEQIVVDEAVATLKEQESLNIQTPDENAQRPATMTDEEVNRIAERESKAIPEVAAAEDMLTTAESMYDDVLSQEMLLALDDQFDMPAERVREIMDKAIEGRGSVKTFNTLVKRANQVKAQLSEYQAAESANQTAEPLTIEIGPLAQKALAAKDEGKLRGALMSEKGIPYDVAKKQASELMSGKAVGDTTAPAAAPQPAVRELPFDTAWATVRKYAGREDAQRRYQDALADAEALISMMPRDRALDTLERIEQTGSNAEKEAARQIRAKIDAPEVRRARSESTAFEAENDAQTYMEAVQLFRGDWAENIEAIRAYIQSSNAGANLSEPFTAAQSYLDQLGSFEENIGADAPHKAWPRLSELVDRIAATETALADTLDQLDLWDQFSEELGVPPMNNQDGATLEDLIRSNEDPVDVQSQQTEILQEWIGQAEAMVEQAPELQPHIDKLEALVEEIESIDWESERDTLFRSTLAKFRRAFDELTDEMMTDLQARADNGLLSEQDKQAEVALRNVVDAFESDDSGNGALRKFSRPMGIRYARNQGQTAREEMANWDRRQRLILAGERAWGWQFMEALKSGRIQFTDKAGMTDLGGGADDTMAMTYINEGRVVINDEAVTPADMAGILLHEVGVHAGLMGLVGEGGFQQVMQAGRKFPCGGRAGLPERSQRYADAWTL